MNKAQRIAEGKVRHGFALLRIFPHAKKLYAGSPVSLYERIHRLEAEAHRVAEHQCNGTKYTDDESLKRKEASILKRLDAILGFRAAGVPIFVNGDARGYALKIEDAYVKEKNLEIERDWGGYGIICPDF